MRIARYLYKRHIHFGIVEDGNIEELEKTPFTGIKSAGRSYPLAEVELLSPVEPSKILAVGLNYLDHARELGLKTPDEPVLFSKPPSALLPHGGDIVYPRMSAEVDYEAELAIVMGAQCRLLTPEEAAAHILGYTCANDVTARDLQRLDGQWTRAKGFDTFCPLGPYISTDEDVCGRRIELRLNGQLRQSSSTEHMIFSCAEVVSFVSHIMTLYPGDVILTGTPPGVGQLRVGDEVEIEIEGMDVLRNKVVAAPANHEKGCA